MCSGRLLLLVCLLGYTYSQSVTTIRKKRISKFRCDFTIVYTNTTVNLDASTIKCSPKKPKKNNLRVTLVSKEGYNFITKINVNPTKIVEMEVEPPATVIPDLFLEEFENITSELPTLGLPQFSGCGGYGGNINGLEERNSPYYQEQEIRGYTKSNIELWKNAEVNWAFVSNGDDYKKFAFHTDAKIGVSENDVKTAMKAMKIIQDKTCIKFKRVQNPDKNKPWIVFFREAQCTPSGQCTCSKPHLASIHLTELGNFGKPFADPWWKWTGNCFGGAFFNGLGAAKPRQFVISAAPINVNSVYDIGLMVHEIGHGLGLGHTQKRPDRDSHITVNWGNIGPNGQGQFDKCTGAECVTHGVPYDCDSIMQYSQNAFSKNGQPTMVAKNENSCNIKKYNYQLVDSDATMLKKMYCDGKPDTGDGTGANKNLVISPNYPNNYDNGVDKEFKVNADEGHIIELWFTDFDIEPETSCRYDWVQIIDGDGTTELLKKSCGKTKPNKVTSKTKSLTVKFHTDGSEVRKGFRAEWKQIKKLTPVDGGWGSWRGWTSCSNNNAGKGDCIKKRSRYCNQPAKANGGKDCEGKDEESAVCQEAELTDPKLHGDCKITGGWSTWGAASTCNTECKSTRTRTCTNPKPFNDKACDGASSKTEPCTGGDCPSSTAGVIESPNFPENYPNSKDERWDLKVADGSSIELKFFEFAIENDASCSYDYVEVLDSDNSQMLKKCGTTSPGTVTSKGNTMTVKFHSDGTVVDKGFKATWKQVDASASGVIKSPNYPNSYTANLDKEYNVEVAAGSKIELTFTDFNIEPQSSCIYDWVQVVDSDGKNIGQKLCGTSKPDPIKSSGNTLKVKFHSDESENYKGFSATWKKVA